MASEIYQDRIEIRVGRTFDQTWPVNDSDDANGDGNTPYNPTGCLVEAEVRAGIGGALVVRFASDGSGDGTITWDSVGDMTLHLDPADTAALSPISNAVWDAQLTDTHGQIWPLLEGPAFVTQEVTGG